MSDKTETDQRMVDLAQENKVLHYMIAALLKTAGGEVKVDKLTLAFLDGLPKFEIAQQEDERFITVKFVAFDPELPEDFNKIIQN